jgi:baculoviral IAP repeat-containing protein 6
MGEALLRSHVQALRQQLGSLPGPARIPRLVLVDNVVEFKVALESDSLSNAVKRFNFLVYEADRYPDSGGVIMSEDEQDEALVEAMNERLSDPDKAVISDALLAALGELGLKDTAVIACLNMPLCGATQDSGQDVSSTNVGLSTNSDYGLRFECEDDSGVDCIGEIVDRECRPGYKRIRWQETEERRIAKRKELCADRNNYGWNYNDTGDMTMEEQKAQDQQMWSSQEAFTILSNELYQLQVDGDTALEADAVDFDVYQWNVRIRGASGMLGRDLQELQQFFGYDYIEIRLSFKEDLHPFYPPAVSIVRPRLCSKHDVLAALTCHPRLQLRGWTPFQTTVDLLFSIRHFLEKIARVDISNEQNDIIRYPSGAFSDLERQLAHLGNLCEITPMDLRLEQDDNPYKDDPWAQNETLTQTSLGAMLAKKKSQEQEKKTGERFWAAGTGYGHDRNGKDMWNPHAMRAVQEAQDEELTGHLRKISLSLCSAKCRLDSRATHWEIGCSAESKEESVEERRQVLAELLMKSCLVWFLQRELSISYTNMGDRLSFFKEIYNLVQELLQALPAHAGTLLAPCREHLRTAKDSAQLFLKAIGKSIGDKGFEDDVSFARLVVETVENVEELRPTEGYGGTVSSQTKGGLGTCNASRESWASWLTWLKPESATMVDRDREEAEYLEKMRGKQLDYCDFGAEHMFASDAERETAPLQARIVRLAKELAGITSLLPLSGSSSVFVRVDNRRQQLWRVLITGPDDTPYSSGCFIFDCYFPSRYPHEPPKVKLVTTGAGTVTFNPNLYSSGKVCLSLLGTWEGDQAEKWDPINSRMLQVLVSIQSLILVPEPYFNEPGFEREIGTEHGELRSREYSQMVREGCVRWAMLDHMSMSSKHFPEFREVFHIHFYKRSQTIQETVAAWVKEAKNHTSVLSRGHEAKIKKLHETLVLKLESPQDNTPDSDLTASSPAVVWTSDMKDPFADGVSDEGEAMPPNEGVARPPG